MLSVWLIFYNLHTHNTGVSFAQNVNIMRSKNDGQYSLRKYRSAACANLCMGTVASRRHNPTFCEATGHYYSPKRLFQVTSVRNPVLSIKNASNNVFSSILYSRGIHEFFNSCIFEKNNGFS